MPNPANTFRRLSARVQSRFRAARPGSVLILVVALLVLMALIGTAWLSTARLDRQSTHLNQTNTQIDLLVDGVIAMVKAAQLNDLKANDVVRPVSGQYGHFDDVQNDAFIASRAPVALMDIASEWTTNEPWYPYHGPGGEFTPPGAADMPAGYVPDPPQFRKYFEGQIVKVTAGDVLDPNEIEFYVCTETHTIGAATNNTIKTYVDDPPSLTHPHWELIGRESSPPNAITGAPSNLGGGRLGYVYSLSIVWPALSRMFPTDQFEDINPADGTAPVHYKRTFMFPTWIDFAGRQKFPALRFYHPKLRGGFGGMVTVPAADTDGDGVADASLMHLPVGTLDGLDYFAAVRLVDGGSAINFNTAWSNVADIDFATVQDITVLGLFQSSVGLQEMFNPDGGARYAEMLRLNNRRFNTIVPADATSESTYMRFNSQGEALWRQMSSRMLKPGPNSDAGPYPKFSAFAAGNDAALAYRGGVLMNPDASLAAVEAALSFAVGQVNTPPAAYPDNDADPSHYDTVRDRTPNRQQIWKTYVDAPLTRGGNHRYDPTAPSALRPVVPFAWNTFVDRWFDENYNNWGYIERAPFPVATGYRMVMGPDAPHDDVFSTVAYPTDGVRRAIRAFLVGRNPVSNQTPGKTAHPLPTRMVVPVPTPDVATASVPDPNSAYNYPAPGANQMAEWKIARPKTSVNTATFEELWRAYWCVMAQDWTSVDPVDRDLIPNATPFTEIYLYALANGFIPFDPYTGMKFASWLRPPPLPATIPQFTIDTTQHWLRMFRSPIRAPHGPLDDPDSVDTWSIDTPRLTPEQVMLLRAAIAANNTLESRDMDHSITPRTITIPAPTAIPPDMSTSGTPIAAVVDSGVALSVRLYGTEAQPYLTEVYANTNAEPYTIEGGGTMTNDNGYIAIEFHNPYPFPIDIRYCKFGVINRQNVADEPAGSNHRDGTFAHSYTVGGFDIFDPTGPTVPVDQRIDLRAANTNLTAPVAHGPTVIPPFGYLVLENYDARGAAGPDAERAMYRPRVAGIFGTDINGGAVIGTPRLNVAYVRNLDRLMNREFVLLRPADAVILPYTAPPPPPVVSGVAGRDVLLYATVDAAGAVVDLPDPATELPRAAVDMIPLDSFDLTGLLHPNVTVTMPAPVRRQQWHYARASYTTDDIPVGTHNPDTERTWSFVYPGRYDANKSNADIVVNLGSQRPRQQGTQEAISLVDGLPGWPTAQQDPWDIEPSLDDMDPATPPAALPTPGPSFMGGGDDGGGAGYPDQDATYTREFPTQVANVDWAGPRTFNPLKNPPMPDPANPDPTYLDSRSVSRSYPHSGFARNGDILRVMFAGSYRIKIASPHHGVGRDGTPAVLRTAATARGALEYNRVLELNALPMDIMFCEDTDPTNDPRRISDGDGDLLAGNIERGIHREQLGRFCPLPQTDLSVAGTGTLDLAVPGATTPTAAADFATRTILYDGERHEGPNYWAGGGPNGTFYDIVITSGPGKGQVRTIIESVPATSSAPPELHVLHPWVDPDPDDNTSGNDQPADPVTGKSNPFYDVTQLPVVGSTYELRRGTYRWATDLFDYLTVQNPHDDIMPVAGGWQNVDSGGGAADDMIPLEGLVNLNTAPWQVLAALPWIPPAFDGTSSSYKAQDLFAYEPETGRLITGAAPGFNPNGRDDNIDLARAIAFWRDRELAAGPNLHNPSAPGWGGIGSHGPFNSLFDLYRVPAVLAVNRIYTSFGGAGGDLDDQYGDLSPKFIPRPPPPEYTDAEWNERYRRTDNVRHDFEEHFLMLNRISNVATTRSDSFTNYLVLQGWRSLGDPAVMPELVVQRRRAFFTDRSRVNATEREIPLQYFFNE